MITIIGLGVVATVAVIRPPRTRVGRVVVSLLVVPAIGAGGWLSLLDVGMGARLIGAATFVAAVAGLVRIWRRK